MHELALFNAMPENTLPALPAVWQEQIAARGAELRAASKSKNTRKAYASDWKQFDAWCQFAGVPALPARSETIAAYLTSMTMSKPATGRDYSTQTIARRLAAIAHFHRAAGLADPTAAEAVKVVMAGIRRENAGRPTQAKGALLTAHLRRGLRAAPKKPSDHRNRALLLIGFAGAFRRSELTTIDMEHLMFDEENRLRVVLPKSKTNQDGQFECKWISPGGENCPIKALREWLRLSGITAGAVFRGVDRHGNVGERLSTDAIAYIVKGCAKRAGLDVREFSAHSLRSGHVTQCILNDVALPLIQKQTGHKQVDTLLRYYRHIEGARNNSSASLGL